MAATNFQDPQSFLSSEIFGYLAPQGGEAGAKWSRLSAVAKRFPAHFIVRERVPATRDSYLSIGAESDYQQSILESKRHVDSVVVATLVKERLVTWAAIDWLADLLTKQLGRKIWPEQIRHSGLKDRWAITAQTVLICGVTVDELKKLSWPYYSGKAGFFLKDIRWHDGRTRVHPAADERRNRVFTEVEAGVVADSRLTREAVCNVIRQNLEKSLSRQFRHEDVRVKSAAGGLRVYVSHATATEVAALEWAEDLGVRLREIRLYRTNALSKGDHRQNRFQLKIIVKGQSSSDVETYLAPLMEKLERRAHCIPNAFNWQRLAARQLGHVHGCTLITGNYQAPQGVHKFGSASEAALYRFLHETSGRENPAAEQMRRDMEPHWLYDFSGMKDKLQRSYRQLNMSVEYKVVERLADTDRYRGDFQEVVRSMSEEVSMWIAAWQSWWWNHVLVRKLPHWVREMEKATAARKQEGDLPGFNPLQRGIPLLMDSPQAREYYERLPYCREALEELNSADDFVRKQFLKPRGNTPWRKAFIRIEGLDYGVGSEAVDGDEQTVVNLQFELPSGAYATTFLGFLFELEEPNKGVKPVGSDSEPVVLEEVAE